MDPTAGYAATISIRQELLQRLIRTFYNAKLLSHSVTINEGGISATLFLDVPQLSASSSDPYDISIDVTAYGPLSITVDPNPTESRRAIFSARITTEPSITIADGSLVFALTGTALAVSNISIVPYAGGPFSQPVQDLFASPGFNLVLTQALRTVIQGFAAIPPIDVSVLGAIALDPTVQVQKAFGDGVIMLGINAEINGVATTGDVTLLTDVSAGNDIGMWTAPLAVPVAYSAIKDEISSAAADYDAVLNSLDLTVHEGRFHIAAHATRGSDSVDFSLDAEPRLIRPGVHVEYDEEYGGHVEYNTPDREDLWFETTNIGVDEHLGWWHTLVADLVSALTLDVGLLVVLAIMDMVRGNITSGIHQTQANGTGRVQQLTFPGVTRPDLMLKIQTFECHDNGVFIGITIGAQFWQGTLSGPSVITAEESQLPAGRAVYKVDLPADALGDDPELRAAWVVRRVDTNAILLSRDTLAFFGLSLGISHSQVPFLDIDKISIAVRVYRTLGTAITEVFSGMQYLTVDDYVDRHHKYIQWHHEAFVPVVRVESNGSHTLLGNQIVERRSAIHRTAFSGRCQMLRHYSTQEFGSDVGFPPVYTDDLPFPLTDIVANRAALCDYCFFGGPSKTVPLIPIP